MNGPRSCPQEGDGLRGGRCSLPSGGAGRVEGRPEAGRRLARLPGQQHGLVLPPTFLVADELM